MQHETFALAQAQTTEQDPIGLLHLKLKQAESISSKEPELALALFRDVALHSLSRSGVDAPHLRARAELGRARILASRGRFDDAVQICDELLSRAETSQPLTAELVDTQILRANCLSDRGERINAIHALDALLLALSPYDTPDNNALAPLVTQALFRRAFLRSSTDAALAIDGYKETIKHYDRYPDAAAQIDCARALLNQGLLIVELQQDAKEAMACFDAIVERFATTVDNDLRTQVALAMFNKAWVQADRLRMRDDATIGYQVLIEYLNGLNHTAEPKSAVVDLRLRPALNSLEEIRARTLFNLAMLLAQRAQYEASLCTFDILLAEFRDSVSLGIFEHQCRGFLNKGRVLDHLGDTLGAIKTYETLLSLIEERAVPLFEEHQIKALAAKAQGLVRLKAYGAALETFDEIAHLFADRFELQLAEKVADARIQAAMLRATQFEEPNRAMRALERVAAIYAGHNHPTMLARVAKAQVQRAELLSQRSRGAVAAIEAYEQVIKRFQQRPEAEIAIEVARAMFARANLLANLPASFSTAIEAFTQMAARFEKQNNIVIIELLARSQLNLASLLSTRSERISDAIRVYDSLIKTYGTRNEIGFIELTAHASLNQAMLFQQHLSDDSIALQAFTDIEKKFRRYNTLKIATFVARAMNAHASMLQHKGETDAAHRLWFEVVRLYSHNLEDELAEQVECSLGNAAAAIQSSSHVEPSHAEQKLWLTRLIDVRHRKPGDMHPRVERARSTLIELMQRLSLS